MDNELLNLTLYQAFAKATISAGDLTALYYFRNKISFDKLMDKVDKWSKILQNNYDIKKGDVVLVSLPNIPQVIILFYALNRIGAIVNMVHPNSPFEVMQKYYDETKCKLAFLFSSKVFKQLKEYRNFKGRIIICEADTYLPLRSKGFIKLFSQGIHRAIAATKKFEFFSQIKKQTDVVMEYPLGPEETSVILHSASTTGVEKSIRLSSRSFNFTASRTPEIMCMSPEELKGKTMISVLPSFHGFGLCMTMHAPLVNQFGVYLIPKFSALEVSKAMSNCKNAISLCGTPNVYKALLNDSNFTKNKYLKTLGSCFSGGDSLSSIIKENFDSLMIRNESRCRLFEGYGLTEALSVCSVNTHRHHRPGSIGYPISGVEFKIFGENNKELGPMEIGEISIKSENIMLGYLHEKDNKEDIFYNGYLKTGDLGYIDEDGFLYFNSRKKRVIKVSGVAVFPHEIEGVISRMSGIDAVCCIQIPDEKLVHAVKAVIVARNKNKERIIEECKKRLISWAVPVEIEFVSKLPMTKLHKVNWKKVQEEEDARREV